jgi:CrcB protein
MAPPAGFAPLPGPLAAPLLVALGAVPGACLRFWLVNRLEARLPRRHWGTLVVNLLACFALGLLLGSAPGPGWPGPVRPGGLELLLVTGFLGSLSTFSTLAAELHTCLLQGQRRQALGLALGSLLGGLLALRLGQLLQGRWLSP